MDEGAVLELDEDEGMTPVRALRGGGGGKKSVCGSVKIVGDHTMIGAVGGNYRVGPREQDH